MSIYDYPATRGYSPLLQQNCLSIIQQGAAAPCYKKTTYPLYNKGLQPLVVIEEGLNHNSYSECLQ